MKGLYFAVHNSGLTTRSARDGIKLLRCGFIAKLLVLQIRLPNINIGGVLFVLTIFPGPNGRVVVRVAMPELTPG